jgi:hypothetical protein
MLDEGRVPVSKVKYFGEGDPIYKQAQQIWVVLCGFAMMRKKLTMKGFTAEQNIPDRIFYSELTQLIGRPGAQRFLSYQLGLIAVYCAQNEIPHLNVLVVNKETNLPGGGVIAESDKPIEEQIEDVLNFDWYAVKVPTLKALKKLYSSDC